MYIVSMAVDLVQTWPGQWLLLLKMLTLYSTAYTPCSSWCGRSFCVVSF